MTFVSRPTIDGNRPAVAARLVVACDPLLGLRLAVMAMLAEGLEVAGIVELDGIAAVTLDVVHDARWHGLAAFGTPRAPRLTL
jgi:hypothetical protein